jgi:hypothetical protein
MYPSRFLKEIPKEFFGHASTSYTQTESAPLNNSVAFEVGAIVRHKDFGRGVVLKAYETSFGLTYDVEFQNDKSKKSLVAKYAKLSGA